MKGRNIGTMFADVFSEELHHAYAISGRTEEILPELLSALEKVIGYRTKGNPDFRLESYDVMGIDEARALKEAATRTAVSEGKKIFVITARGITNEAQNALLKTFEDPFAGTHFFLLIPSVDLLLPTLRSRLFVIGGSATSPGGVPSSLASDFLSDPIPKRLKTIQGLLKKSEEESGKRELLGFLDALEFHLATKDRATTAQALFEVLNVKRYSRDRAPSFKLLLEHLALVLPKI